MAPPFTPLDPKLLEWVLTRPTDRVRYDNLLPTRKNFDEIMDRYQVEKIKTIGDSYMCAGGLPLANGSHPVDVVLSALEIRSFMQQMKEIKQAVQQPYWELRIGIHTGPVVAGVVGKRTLTASVQRRAAPAAAPATAP